MKYQLGEWVKVETIGKVVRAELKSNGTVCYDIKRSDEEFLDFLCVDEKNIHSLPTEIYVDK